MGKRHGYTHCNHHSEDSRNPKKEKSQELTDGRIPSVRGMLSREASQGFEWWGKFQLAEILEDFILNQPEWQQKNIGTGRHGLAREPGG